MEPSARAFVGSLLLFVLCSVAPPLAHAQTCASNGVTSSSGNTCTASCTVPATQGLLQNQYHQNVGARQDSAINTAPACCASCALAAPSACVIWSFLYFSPPVGGPPDPETQVGACYFLSNGDCANVRYEDTYSGQSAGRPCPILPAPAPAPAAISVSRDPHCNVGGITFDFHGIAGTWYAFLTDIGLQINAKLVGPTAECPEKKTWLEQIAVLWTDEYGKKRSLAVKVDQEANWYEDVLYFESDGQRVEAPVPVTRDASDSEPQVAWMAADGSASVLRVPNQWNASVLSIPDVIMVDISSAVDEWIQGSADPLGAYGKYLDMSITYVRPPSPTVHGIIGQMLQPNAYETKMAIETSDGENRERVEGNDEMYQVAGLTDTVCHFCRFDQGTIE